LSATADNRFRTERLGPAAPSGVVEKAKQIDPKAVEELAEEVKRHKENAERFVNKC
jgi:hypothetical protein